MDIITEAQAAIERWVETNQPTDANLKWIARTPTSHWKFTEAAWVTEFNTIIGDFEARIDQTLSIATHEKRASAGKDMGTNWFFLVAKAQSKVARTIIQEFSA
jgi:hypothetical protein